MFFVPLVVLLLTTKDTKSTKGNDLPISKIPASSSLRALRVLRGKILQTAALAVSAVPVTVYRFIVYQFLSWPSVSIVVGLRRAFLPSITAPSRQAYSGTYST